jgi:hypothetical protein
VVRAAAAALVALVAALAFAAPAGAAAPREVQAAAFAIPTPTAPVRDLVIEHPNRAAVRARASGPLGRYPVNDGAGGSIEVVNHCVPVICDATPEEVAAFLGTVAHRDEINLLTVLLVPPAEVAAQCGSAAAQACYYPSLNQMVINGDKSPASDGASWEFVISHEYGHHLANHRDNSPFDSPAIDWGPKNWASYARVCEGVRANRYFPGDEGDHYFQNPGEAFAESFAHNRFPSDPVPWAWPDFPVPEAGAYVAIQRDAVTPWAGASIDKRKGHFPKRRRPRRKSKHFATPRDGDLKITLAGPDRADLSLKLFASDGRLLGRSDGVGSKEQVSYRICGERAVDAVVRRHGRRLTRFKVTGFVP